MAGVIWWITKVLIVIFSLIIVIISGISLSMILTKFLVEAYQSMGQSLDKAHEEPSYKEGWAMLKIKPLRVNLERYKDLLEDVNDLVDRLDKEDEKEGLEAEERRDVRAKLIDVWHLVDLWLQEEEQKEKE